MEPEPHLLFVYGTLRPALARGEPAGLVRSLACLGPATVRGALYDLGGYPGLVTGDGTVHGELLAVDSPAWLATLDAYEECSGSEPLYVRERMPAVRPDGSVIAAWGYRFVRPVAAARLIPGGDYAAYVADRAQRPD
jgi:gamma-glutamylcyclotransferase (GGCT)/AIG2-like uncharacterized protein YtfP